MGGEFLQLVGSQQGRLFGEEYLGAFGVGGGDVMGQVVEELVDDAQVLAVECSGVPGVGGGGQFRGHRRAGEAGAGCQSAGLADAPLCFAGADPQHVGEDSVASASEVVLAAPVERGGRVVGDGGGPPAGGFEAVQRRKEFPDGEAVPVERVEGGHGRIQPGERIVNRTHVRNITTGF